MTEIQPDFAAIAVFGLCADVTPCAAMGAFPKRGVVQTYPLAGASSSFYVGGIMYLKCHRRRKDGKESKHSTKKRRA